MAVTLGIPKEMNTGETRVAAAPDQIRRFLKTKDASGSTCRCLVQEGAGALSFASDDDFRAVGAEIVSSREDLWSGADVVACVSPPPAGDIASMKADAVLLGMLRPASSRELMQACLDRRITAIAFEALPRITRAQSADALSSMSTVAGYRAALLAAELCPKFFPMMMTAAGTVTPAKVLVIGAGVAGLQAIATARRLGAVVEAYDIRPVAKEQVLSLGARFVELDLETGEAETAGGYAKEQSAQQQQRQRDLLAERIAASDVVITTALIPGRPAPRLIDADVVDRMKPGSSIVDLAAEAGGNCELTDPGATIDHHGVRIAGPTNLPAQLPVHASQMYGQNVIALLRELAPEGELVVDLDNDVIGPACITHAGEAMHGPLREALGLPPLQPQETSS